MPANIVSKLETSCSRCRRPGGSQAVDPRGPALRGDAFFRFQPAFPQHALQRGIERAFLDLQQVVGDLLDVLDQRIAVHRLQPERVEDHHFERAGEEVAALRVSWPCQTLYDQR